MDPVLTFIVENEIQRVWLEQHLLLFMHSLGIRESILRKKKIHHLW